MNRHPPFFTVLLAIVHLFFAATPVRAEDSAQQVILATTTSVRDAGLLDALLPIFRQRTGIEVQLIAVGSGAAIALARDGNADLVLAHAPEAEQSLVADGIALDRRPFAENFFVIAGPEDDPAGVKTAPNAVEAMRRIHATQSPFASRADESGTHQKERALRKAAGLEADPQAPGLLRTGAGMGPTLQVAGEKRAYVLTDEATLRAFRERIDLVALTGRDPALRNVYSVLRIDPTRFAAGQIHAEAATRLADFLSSDEVRTRIASFGTENGAPSLFTPLAGTQAENAPAPAADAPATRRPSP
jgi:tungstate transport system substrate-binding protein